MKNNHVRMTRHVKISISTKENSHVLMQNVRKMDVIVAVVKDSKEHVAKTLFMTRDLTNTSA
jgi:hypothetical protein